MEVFAPSEQSSNNFDMPARVIGRYTHDMPGPMLIVIAGIHGNERAGVQAVRRVLELLKLEKDTHPEFTFSGTLAGVAGNLQALNKNVRYLKRDMNRFLIPEYIQQLRQQPYAALQDEDREIAELTEAVENLVKQHNPDRVYILDLHTTTAHDGVFCLVTSNPDSIRMGLNLKVPVIHGFMDGLPGTTMDYFTEANTGVPTTGVVFESGQHQEGESVDNAISATVNCLRSIGCVPARYVETRHDERLEAFASNLPGQFVLQYIHRITEDDSFVMRRGFHNYSPVKRGDWLGTDRYGAVLAECDGMLLMPLYQKQGSDGFFVIRPLEE